MGDAWIKGGRAGGRAGWSGEDKPRPRRNYSEHWMERIVRGLYHSAADEPVPEDMLEIVRRLPLKEPPSKQTPGRQDEPSAGENRGMLRKNVRDLNCLLDFKVEDSKEEMITLLAEPQQRRPPGSPVSPTKSNLPPAAPSPDAMDRARKWRARAKECRTAAESMSTGAARSSLLQRARDYEASAELAEKEAHQRKESEMEHGLKHSSLRKRQLRADDPTSVDAAGEVDLVSCATIGFSSEDPAHPVEHLFDGSSGPGTTRWSGARPNTTEQILVEFDAPQTLSRLLYEVEEAERERTQEVRVEVSEDGGRSYRQILDQEYNFSPAGATYQREEQRFKLHQISHLRLTIVPNKNGSGAATLTALRLFA